MTRVSRLVAAVATVAGLAMLVASVPIEVGNARAAGGRADLVDSTLFAGSWVAFGPVGAVVVWRRPRNLVGWLMVGITSLMGLLLFGEEYATWSHRLYAGALPFDLTLLALAAAVEVLPFAMVPLLLVLFPDGRLPVGRMRWTVRALAVLVALDTLVYAFRTSPDPHAVVESPLAILGPPELTDAMTANLGAGIAVCFLVIVVDFVRRFRRADGVRRQQFRWLARASLVAPVLFAVGVLIPESYDQVGVTDWTEIPILGAYVVGLPAMAASIGMAVLRYRLWDIDRVVSRTVTYAVVTAVLAGTYAGLVLGVQAVAGPDQASDLLVAGSTLVAAALFRPVRDRVQRVVDRRFDRARFDHDRILGDVAGRLRDEVDHDAVEEDILGTVQRSLAPTTVSLWLPIRSP